MEAFLVHFYITESLARYNYQITRTQLIRLFCVLYGICCFVKDLESHANFLMTLLLEGRDGFLNLQTLTPNKYLISWLV